MAIGLGCMFGFHFEENFNSPYMTKSVGEFWRRWHISMGSWFRDYVYFPLGGSKVSGTRRIIFNLFVVWLLTGIWHGANWTFVVWGLWHFLWIAFERISGIPKRCGKIGAAVYRVITLAVVVIGWVLFRADTTMDALIMLKAMMGVGVALTSATTVALWKDSFVFIVLGIICATPVVSDLAGRYMRAPGKRVVVRVSILALLLIGISFSITTSYDPFIYFNF